MRTTNIRFTGLASGLDTESIVQSMVMPYKMKVDSKWQEKTLMEMKKESWRDMNKKIFDFHDKYIGKMRLESTFNKKSISVSNSNVITVDKNSNLPTGTHKIESITQLAQGATIGSSKIDIDVEKKLSEQDGYKDLVGQKVTINGKEIKITEEDTIGSLTKKMQQAAPDLNVSFDTNNKAFFISSKKTGESQSIQLGGDSQVWDKLGIKNDVTSLKFDKIAGNIKVTINAQEVIITDTDSTEAIINKLEGALNKGSDPSASVEYKDGEFIIKGKGQDIAVSNGVQKEYISQGKNAILSYNGVEITSESNNISVNGLNFSINSTTKDEITLVSTQDTDAMVNFMKEFVDEYNKLIDDIHTKLGATSNKNYPPLTEEQKKEMSDYEIEAWEKKIKDGMFRNDPDLKKVTDTMRQVLSGSVEGGTFSSFSEIGITTGNWKENGKLHFDEDKFKTALAKDTDGVVQLISGSGNTESVYEKDRAEAAKKGETWPSWEDLTKSTVQQDKDKVAKYQNRTKSIGDRLYETITEATRSTTLRSAYSFYNDKALDKKILTAKDEVSKLETRMYRMEDMYYKKFTAMEKMMQQLNNQSNWLTSQMG